MAVPGRGESQHTKAALWLTVTAGADHELGLRSLSYILLQLALLFFLLNSSLTLILT